jgi:tetratricopeptide (TPR) repeat protein
MADHAAKSSANIIEAAISVFEEILRLRPVGHERRREATGDLGNVLFWFCWSNRVDPGRPARCVDLLRETLHLCPPGDPSRDQALHNLARALVFLGYERQPGRLDILAEAILLNRQALQLRPPDHHQRSASLSNLAATLERSFQNCGDLDLLSEAIAMHREALQLEPFGHPGRDSTLINLAAALKSSFQYQGRLETLAEAIRVGREALQLRPVGHPLRGTSLSSLGDMLRGSFTSYGIPELLSESICLHQEAVHLMPSTHPNRGIVLTNLAQSLMDSFRRHHDRAVLEEAITLLRQAVRLPSGGGEAYSERLHELAAALTTSFDEHKKHDHLIEAISLHRKALQSRPPGHFLRMESLQKLGRLLCRSECQSWNEALALYREALIVSPTGFPLRAEVLSDTSRCFLDPESPFFDLSKGVAHLSEAYSDNFCPAIRRLRSAMSDLPRVESAYIEAVKGFDSSSLQSFGISILNLYAQVIDLLPRGANFGLDHSTRLQAVTGLDAIARDAAARAVLLERNNQALEMLEEGRGVFWAQALRLRTSTFDNVPPEDSKELQRLLGLLDFSTLRIESPDQSAAQRDHDMERRRQLNEEAEAVILKIRGYAGLDRFLLPPAFDALVGALPDGFVVIVNASKLGYHALLLHRNIGTAQSLALQPPSTGFDSVALRSHVPRDLGFDMREEGYRAMRKDSGQGGSFMNVLTVLWTTIVHPVITQLGIQVSHAYFIRR